MPYTAARIVHVIVSYTVSGNRMSCTFSYGASAAIDINDANELAIQFINEVLPAFYGTLSQDVRIQDVYAVGEAAFNTIPARHPQIGVVGGVTGDSIPSNLPAVIRFYQSETTGRHSGRVFMSGVAESQVTDGMLTASAVGDTWEDLRVALALTLTTTGPKEWNLCVVQRTAAGVPITTVGNIVNQVLVTRALASMRRRTTELREVHG